MPAISMSCSTPFILIRIGPGFASGTGRLRSRSHVCSDAISSFCALMIRPDSVWIDASQVTEIEQMRNWLTRRGEPAPILHRAHGHAHGIGQGQMPGMLNDAQLRKLEGARGAAFDRLFLRYMIQHHHGALVMVQRLYADDGGAESEADAFARSVDSDQMIEIERMQGMLDARTS